MSIHWTIRFVNNVLVRLRRQRRDRVLAEGYRFYAQTDVQLAEEGLAASFEVWPEY